MPDGRTYTLKIRLTEEQRQDLDARAKDAGVPMSQFARELLFDQPDLGPEDALATEASIDVSKLEHQLHPQSKGHLERFPGDAKTDAQRIAFDGLVRELHKKMPLHAARITAASQLFPRKEAA